MNAAALMLSAQFVGLTLLGVLVFKQGKQRSAPVFALYVIYSIGSIIAQLIFSSDQPMYFKVYWIAEAGALLLAIASVYEAFAHSFRGYFVLAWFRCLLPGIAVAIASYAIWKALARPPVLNGPLTAIIVGIEIGAQYLILVTFICQAVLLRLLKSSHSRFEFRVAAGFSISSLGMLLATMLRSEFGTSFFWLITWGPSVSYSIALLIWIGSCLSPEAAVVSRALETSASGALEHLEQCHTALKKVESARWR